MYAALDMGPVTLPSPKELTDYAAKHGAELIIMTTLCYSGIRHTLLGSTTEAVLRQAPCPVLSVRSEE